jgi:hypothetical protein
LKINHANQKKEEKFMRRTLLTLAVLIFSIISLFPDGFKVEPGDTIKFHEKSKLESFPISFCVTDDGFFLIPDQKIGYIKIFEKDGEYLKLVKKFGRNGNEDDEFDKPAYCFYNQYEDKFGVVDIRIKSVFIFDRLNKSDFKLIKKIRAESYNMKLGSAGKRLIVSGYITDKEENSYELYSINPNDPKQKEYLLSSPEKYGLSENEYQIEYFQKRTLPAIGIRSFIDVQGNDVYFVWEGKLRIIKIDIKTGEQTSFGHLKNQRSKMPNYIEPYASKALLDARRNKDFTKTRKERFNMSLVRDIFATPRHVIVVYEGPNVSNFRMQMYTLEGKFLGDKPILGKPGRTMYFDKDSYTLYSLSETRNKEIEISMCKLIYSNP